MSPRTRSIGMLSPPPPNAATTSSDASTPQPPLSNPPSYIAGTYDPALDLPRYKWLLARTILPVESSATSIDVPPALAQDLLSRQLPLPRTTTPEQRQSLRTSLIENGLNDAEQPLVIVLVPPRFLSDPDRLLQQRACTKLQGIGSKQMATEALAVDIARELAGVVLVGRSRWVELLAAGDQTNIEQVHVEIYSHDVFLEEPALYSYFVADTNQHRTLETIGSSLSLLDVLQISIAQRSAGVRKSVVFSGQGQGRALHALYELSKNRVAAELVCKALSDYSPLKILLSASAVDTFVGLFNNKTLGQSSLLLHHQLASTCRFLNMLDPSGSLPPAFWHHLGNFANKKEIELLNPLHFFDHSPHLHLLPSNDPVRLADPIRIRAILGARVLAKRLEHGRQGITSSPSAWRDLVGTPSKAKNSLGFSFSTSDLALVADPRFPVMYPSIESFEGDLDKFIRLLFDFDPGHQPPVSFGSPVLFTSCEIKAVYIKNVDDPGPNHLKVARDYFWKPLETYLKNHVPKLPAGDLRLDQLFVLALADDGDDRVKGARESTRRSKNKTQEVPDWLCKPEESRALKAVVSFVSSTEALEQLATSQIVLESGDQPDSVWLTPSWRIVAQILVSAFPGSSRDAVTHLRKIVHDSQTVHLTQLARLKKDTNKLSERDPAEYKHHVQTLEIKSFSTRGNTRVTLLDRFREANPDPIDLSDSEADPGEREKSPVDPDPLDRVSEKGPLVEEVERRTEDAGTREIVAAERPATDQSGTVVPRTCELPETKVEPDGQDEATRATDGIETGGKAGNETKDGLVEHEPSTRNELPNESGDVTGHEATGSPVKEPASQAQRTVEDEPLQDPAAPTALDVGTGLVVEDRPTETGSKASKASSQGTEACATSRSSYPKGSKLFRGSDSPSPPYYDRLVDPCPSSTVPVDAPSTVPVDAPVDASLPARPSAADLWFPSIDRVPAPSGSPIDATRELVRSPVPSQSPSRGPEEEIKNDGLGKPDVTEELGQDNGEPIEDDQRGSPMDTEDSQVRENTEDTDDEIDQIDETTPQADAALTGVSPSELSPKSSTSSIQGLPSSSSPREFGPGPQTTPHAPSTTPAPRPVFTGPSLPTPQAPMKRSRERSITSSPGVVLGNAASKATRSTLRPPKLRRLEYTGSKGDQDDDAEEQEDSEEDLEDKPRRNRRSKAKTTSVVRGRLRSGHAASTGSLPVPPATLPTTQGSSAAPRGLATAQRLDALWDKLDAPRRYASANRDIFVLVFRLFWTWYQNNKSGCPDGQYPPHHFFNVYTREVSPAQISLFDALSPNLMTPDPDMGAATADNSSIFFSYVITTLQQWWAKDDLERLPHESTWLATMETWAVSLANLGVPKTGFVNDSTALKSTNLARDKFSRVDR